MALTSLRGTHKCKIRAQEQPGLFRLPIDSGQATPMARWTAARTCERGVADRLQHSRSGRQPRLEAGNGQRVARPEVETVDPQ